MNVQIANTAGIFLIAGLVVFALLVVFTLRRPPSYDGFRLGVSNTQLLWIALFVLAVVDIAFAGAKLLYPAAEMSFEMSPVLDFLKAAFWPVAFIIAISHFAKPISTFLENLTSANVDIAGSKIELQRKVQEVSTALSVAESKSTDAKEGNAASPDSIANLARNAVSNMGLVGQSRPPRLLWVDDAPRNNESLVESFEAVGMRIDKALDTAQGLAMLDRLSYDLIVEDMGRPSGNEAGYEFLQACKEKGIVTPVIIFAARMGSPDLRNDAIGRGAIAATNRPSEVFRLVTTLAPQLAATRT